MKKLSTFCLLALPFCCFSQTKTADIDSLFEKYCVWGVICETELSKYEFDTSESVILTGFARNCSKTDSVFFAVMPTGADYNLSFSLRNLSNPGSYEFMDLDLMFENHTIVKPTMKTIQKRLAPGERIEVFSFDLSKLQNLPLARSFSPGQSEPPQIHINLWPGIYEFTWSCGLAVKKPAFFKVNWNRNRRK